MNYPIDTRHVNIPNNEKYGKKENHVYLYLWNIKKRKYLLFNV